MKNRSKVLNAGEYALEQQTKFSSELETLLASGGANLRRATVFVRKNITNAAGIFDIIDENTSKVDGISSISKTSLPKNEALIFDRIAIAVANGTVTLNEEGISLYDGVAVPAEVRNATLVLTQNGREVLNLPVADMLRAEATKAEDAYHDLESFHYLVDDQPMEWRMRFPSGASVKAGGVNNDFQKYLEVRLQGFKTARKVA